MDKSYDFDEIGYWSEIKLDIVREYAKAYTTVISAQKNKRHPQERLFRRIIYIDAFAGYGKHIAENSGEIVLGSPTNALLVQPPFTEYHFIDLDERKIASLSQIAAERTDVCIHHGDCNEVLLTKVLPRCRRESFARALCLLDPYGLNVKWDVFLTAGQMGSVEIFFNFMIMDANRNILWKDPDKVSPKQRERMNFLWGDNSWFNKFYKKQRNLFEDEWIKSGNQEITRAFNQRLKEVAGFEYVADPIPMRNNQGATVYYLCFASNNKSGHTIVSDIFNKYRNRNA